MAKIAIVGAGRVGTAAAKILLTLTDHEIVFIDISEEALAAAFEACVKLPRASVRVAMSPDVPVTLYRAEGVDELRATFASLDTNVVLCTTPFNINVDVATLCAELEMHYVDFTEDNTVTETINRLDIGNGLTFIPQTGLAPGLVNYIGLSLFESLGEPHLLELRVGALPQVSFGPAHYAVTWSVEGLINEYIHPALRLENGELQCADPLTDLQSVIVNGVQYECFNTAGGVGMLSAYAKVPNVQYKTLRFPGHLAFLKKFLGTLTFEDAVAKAKESFVTTRDDVVVLAAQAVDVNGKSASAGLHFYPCEDLDLTALELTTAGIGVAVVELLLDGKLQSGILNASQIPFDDLMQTHAARFVFDYMN